MNRLNQPAMKIIGMCLLILTTLNRGVARAERQFAHPDRIKYDGQCLTVDGKDMIIYSGSFHYFRCPKPLWADRFQKIKDAGFNTVETYVPWNVYEVQQPSSPDDFSKMQSLDDFRDWLKMAHDQFGLYTIIRPGPYICAEWAGGGFPTWLILKRKPEDAKTPFMRSDNPDFMAWSKHWYHAVVPIIAAEQVTKKPVGKPGTILFQIENEYDGFKGLTDAQRATYLKSLYDEALADGIDVPIFTCASKTVSDLDAPGLSNVFGAINCYPRWNFTMIPTRLDDLRKRQPDAPLMTPELQGGWFSAVGGKLSKDQDGLTPDQINETTLNAWAHGATITNYYMVFGGTNFGDWGSRTMTTTYDYAAPIAESGGVGEKYAVVKGLGAMLKEVGPQLARTKLLDAKTDGFDKDIQVIVRRSNDDAMTFVFCFNGQRKEAHEGVGTVTIGDEPAIHVSYKLDAAGFKVLCLNKGDTTGKWLPQLGELPARPATLPPAVHIADIFSAENPEPKWTDLSDNASLPSLGIMDSRYVMYRSHADVDDPAKYPTLNLVLGQDDPVVLMVNGKVVHSPLNQKGATFIPVQSALTRGDNTFVVLYENQGYDKGFGKGSANVAGILSGALMDEKSKTANHLPLKWQLADQLGGDLQWAKAVAPSDGSMLMWYKVEFELPATTSDAWIPWLAKIDATGNGMIDLNGHAIGRWWQVGPQKDYYLPECWLNFGAGKKNVLTFCLRRTDKPPVLNAVDVMPYATDAEKR